MRYLLCLSLLLPHLTYAQSTASVDEGIVLVDRDQPSAVEPNFEQLARTFTLRGSTAVAAQLRAELHDPEQLKLWQTFADSGQARIVHIHVHPNETAAVRYLNQRFQRMGLQVPAQVADDEGQIKRLVQAVRRQLGRDVESKPTQFNERRGIYFQPVSGLRHTDPTQIDEATIGPRKWLRLLGGPGVATAAFLATLPHPASGLFKDLIYMILPVGTVAVATVGLEIMFALPSLNNRIWKPFNRWGGPVIARLNNIGMNFIVGMGLFGAGLLGAHLPTLWGAPPVPHGTQSLNLAMWNAAIGAISFHFAFGQFQTDLALEEKHGAITTNTRYGLETTGAVVVNGARVASWMLPAAQAYYTLFAQAGFFLLKTLPQAIKTNVADRFFDRRTAGQINPAKATKPNAAFHCANALEWLGLINLPHLERSN